MIVQLRRLHAAYRRFDDAHWFAINMILLLPILTALAILWSTLERWELCCAGALVGFFVADLLNRAQTENARRAAGFRREATDAD